MANLQSFYCDVSVIEYIGITWNNKVQSNIFSSVIYSQSEKWLVSQIHLGN